MCNFLPSTWNVDLAHNHEKKMTGVFILKIAQKVIISTEKAVRAYKTPNTGTEIIVYT
jgi:hypothetical protein